MAKEKHFSPELEKFLKSKRKFTAAKEHKINHDKRHSKTLKTHEHIMLAFRWKDTEEGYAFWKNLSEEFNNEKG